MKLALTLALALAFTGVTLVATADEAAACIPPNCPGFGKCVLRDEHYAEVYEPTTGFSHSIYLPKLECYY